MTIDHTLLNGLTCDILALGEPSHGDESHLGHRNRLVSELVERGFRSIALESNRVAALMVDDYVQGGPGTLERVLRDGFSHDFGTFEGNRDLVQWMRAHNLEHPPAQRVRFYGFDIPAETMMVPSPRSDLVAVCDYLGVESLPVIHLAGEDQPWTRVEAALHPAESVGLSPAAMDLTLRAQDLRRELFSRAAELVAATSVQAWRRAEAHLDAAQALLGYHRECARPDDSGHRICRLSGTRDAFMAQNLLTIREIEADRGPTVVFAHNSHLQPTRSEVTWEARDGWPAGHMSWWGAGAIVGSLLGTRYLFIEGGPDGL